MRPHLPTFVSAIFFAAISLLMADGSSAQSSSQSSSQSAAQPAKAGAEQAAATRWIDFPAQRQAHHIQLSGLPWFDDKIADFGRFSRSARSSVPAGVWTRSREPSGGRIRFRSDTTQLSLRLQGEGKLTERSTMSAQGSRGLDIYVAGDYWKSVIVNSLEAHKRPVFRGVERRQREFTIYLPVGQPLKVLAIGVDDKAQIAAPAPFSQPKPIVFYGSSVAQGSGVSRPAMTYEAILARQLNVDFVNLGFGGAGKAEPAVVDLVASVDACCYVFDLGRSYGDQDKTAYKNMLTTVRARRPGVPLVCILPIYNPAERHDARWLARTEHTRRVFREAYDELKPTDRQLHVVGEFDLLRPTEGDGSNEGIHPSDFGYHLMAQRLAPILKPLLP